MRYIARDIRLYIFKQQGELGVPPSLSSFDSSIFSHSASGGIGRWQWPRGNLLIGWGCIRNLERSGTATKMKATVQLYVNSMFMQHWKVKPKFISLGACHYNKCEMSIFRTRDSACYLKDCCSDPLFTFPPYTHLPWELNIFIPPSSLVT